MQRVDTPEFWQSVTGGLELDELAPDAARRELNEETGIDIADNSALITNHHCSTLFEIGGVWRQRYHPDHTHNREHLFSVRLERQIDIHLNCKEHSACIWLPAEQALMRATSVTNKQAIENIVLNVSSSQ